MPRVYLDTASLSLLIERKTDHRALSRPKRGRPTRGDMRKRAEHQPAALSELTKLAKAEKKQRAEKAAAQTTNL